jgi:predicted DNA-binding transcriptional regulator AlpA
MQMPTKGAPAAPDGYLPARLVWERFSISSMTLWRWCANDRLGFPKPRYFGRFRYFRLSELTAWEESRPRSGSPIEALAEGRRHKTAETHVPGAL